jgi:excinuclease UvrABC ATPase subunit
VVIDRGNGDEWLLSEQNACPVCGLSFPDLTPAMFSFNSPIGMCPECNGLGTKVEFDPDWFVDPDKSLHEGGVRTWGELAKKKSSGRYQVAKQILERFGHDLDTPWRKLSEDCQRAILYGGVKVTWQSESDRAAWQGEWKYEGTVNATRRRYRQTVVCQLYEPATLSHLPRSAIAPRKRSRDRRRGDDQRRDGYEHREGASVGGGPLARAVP